MAVDKVQIVYLDDSDAGVEQEMAHIGDVFTRVGLPSEIQHVCDYDRDVKSTKKGVFAKGVVDVFVTDMYLGDSGPEGLTAAQEVKRAHPDVLVIGISKFDITYMQTAQKVPCFDLFIHRTYWRNEDYKDYLASCVERLFARNVYASLDVEASELPKKWQASDKAALLCGMLRTATYTSHRTPPETAVRKVRLTPLDGGRSSSDVYSMQSTTAQNLNCVSAVLKIDAIEKSREELDNYQSYVKWYLPYNWRTELIGAAQSRSHGAICYAFANEPSSPFVSLSQKVEAGDAAIVREVIDTIFKPEHQRWYAKENQSRQSGLTKYYDHKWFDGRADPSATFKKALVSHDVTNSTHVVVSGRRYPMPRTFLLGIERDEYMECICHGDLHSGNVLVTERSDIVFIDFQLTGLGHVYEDFVTFEASLRCLWPLKVNLESSLESEWRLLNGEVDSDSEYEVLVNSLRLQAAETFGESYTRYVYALALQSYRALRAAWATDEQVARHVGCLLAAMRYLEEHEDQDLT